MADFVDKTAFFGVPLAEVDVEVVRLGMVHLRELNGTLRDEWENYTVQRRVGQGKDSKPDTRGVKALAIQLSVIDTRTGTFMFDRKDIARIQAMPGDILDGLFGHIKQLNKLYEEDVKAAEGNSDGEGNDTTGSASPQG